MRYTLLLLSGLLIQSAMGQNRIFSGGFFPEAQLTYSPKDNLKLTGKIESQHGMVRNSDETDVDVGYYHDRTDLQGFVGTSLNPFISVAGGYQFRWTAAVTTATVPYSKSLLCSAGPGTASVTG